MNNKVCIEQLLLWRLAQAEAMAPPAPRAAELLAKARPWWETWPEQFRELASQLGRIQTAYGHAMAESRQPNTGHPVPTLVIIGDDELESAVRALYISVRDGRLRFRFQWEGGASTIPRNFEATFVTETLRPLFSAPAVLSIDSEYSVDTELPDELARDWEQLRVTDQLPFRLMLRSDKVAG
jgi:hypothetical protein